MPKKPEKHAMRNLSLKNFLLAPCTLFFYTLLLFFGLSQSVTEAENEKSPTQEKKLTLYTALTATTPQIPLWAAINAGWPAGYTLDAQYWKTLDDLRGLMLAGKGDLWVGHLEGFAQAARRGAPVTLVAVTGWKKFYFISTDPELTGKAAENSLDALAETLRSSGKALAVAPQGSPAIGVLENMAARGGPVFALAPIPPQQLMLEMVRGSRQYALLPEPFVSALLAKNPRLRIVASLEEEFARRFEGLPRLPLTGIAVRTGFAEENPELVQNLVLAMQTAAARLADNPKEAAAALPESVRAALGQEVLEASLARDPVQVEPASAVRAEINAFLRLVSPESYDPNEPDRPPSKFFFLPDIWPQIR
jgi:NitT/TauT family transport system substrate-binding protein